MSIKHIFSKLRTNQVGDTIVEVLIATVIIGAMLAGAYGLSNKSLINERKAEETSEATELLQGQIEQLRAYLEVSGNTVNSSWTNFCMILDNPVQDTGGGSKACVFGNTAASVATGNYALQPGYKLNLSYNTADNDWVGIASWAQLGSSVNANLTLTVQI